MSFMPTRRFGNVGPSVRTLSLRGHGRVEWIAGTFVPVVGRALAVWTCRGDVTADPVRDGSRGNGRNALLIVVNVGRHDEEERGRRRRGPVVWRAH